MTRYFFSMRLAVSLAMLTSWLGAQDVSEKWNERTSGTGDGLNTGLAVSVDDSGNVIAAGAVTTSGNGLDLFAVKYGATDGVDLWDDRYNGTGDADDVGLAVVLDNAGNPVVAGSSTGSSDNLDIFLRKFNGATGAVLWSERYNGPSDGDDEPAALALDAEGNVVVTGSSFETGQATDMYTAKYAAATGNRIWFRRYDGPGGAEDAGTAVAVDAAGAVLVAGTSAGNTSKDIYVAKYEGSTNTVVWDDRYDGPGGGEDTAAGLVVDAAGNAIVAGTTSNNGNLDLYVSKLASADGDELWSTRDNGPNNRADEATAIAIDSRGDVMVVGGSDNGRNEDYVLVKFSGADGRKLWSDYYNGTGDGEDQAMAVAVDPQDNVIVTGTSEGAEGNLDFFTACHDGRTGRRIWFERFNGPRNRDESINRFGLALGPLNSVVLTGSTQTTDPPLPESEFITILYTAVVTDTDADGLPDEWEVFHWGTIAGHGPADDSDNDGVVELLEYAFGMDPTFADPERMPAPTVVDGFLTLSLVKRPGVSFTVEMSNSLSSGSWSPDGTVVVSDTAGSLIVRDSTPVSDGGPKFMRARVSAP